MSTASSPGILEAKAHLDALAKSLDQELQRITEMRIKLDQDIAAFEEHKLKLSSTHLVPSVVTLNIGGTTFMTAKENLLKEKGSFLESMFTSLPLKPSVDGSYFIDRDPTNVRGFVSFFFFLIEKD